MSKVIYEFGLFREVENAASWRREWETSSFARGRFVEVKGKNYHRIRVGEPSLEITGVERSCLHFPDLSACVWTGIRGYVAGAVLLKDNVPIAVIAHGSKMKPGDTLRLQNQEKP